MAISKMFGYDVDSPVTWNEISSDPIASNYVMGKLWPSVFTSKNPAKSLSDALQSSGVVDYIKNPTSELAQKFFKQEFPNRLKALATSAASSTDPSILDFYKNVMQSEAEAAKKYGFEQSDVDSYINQAQEAVKKAQEEAQRKLEESKKPGITAFGGIKADVPISQYELDQRPDLKAIVDKAPPDLAGAKNQNELLAKAINNSGIVDAIKNNTKYNINDIQSKFNKEIGFNFLGMHADIPFTYTQLTKDPVLNEYLFNNVNIGRLKSNEQLTNDLINSGIVDAAADPKGGAYNNIKTSVMQSQADGLRRAFIAYYAVEAIDQGKKSGAIPQRYWGDLSFTANDPESLKAQIARAQSFGVSPDTVNSLLQSTQSEGLNKAKEWVNDIAIFYDPHATHEGGASWVRALGPVLSLASFAVPALAPLAAFTNAGQALQSGNILGGLAAATGIPGVSDVIGTGAAAALQKAGQAANVAKSLETGNLLGALTSGANLTGTGGVQLGDTGLTVADALKAANAAKAIESGDIGYLINVLAPSKTVSGPNASDFEPGYFEPGGPGYYDKAVEESIAPTTDSLGRTPSNQEILEAIGYVPPETPQLKSTDVDLESIFSAPDSSFKADYTLFPTSPRPTLEEMGGAQGVKAPSLPDVFTEEGAVDYGLVGPSLYGGEPGLTMPKTPNLESMGGGQGITMPVEGGTMTEAGLIPEGYTPPLGDLDSFINKPAPGGDVSDAVQKAINASSGGANGTTTPGANGTTTPGAKPTGPTTPTPTTPSPIAPAQAGGMDLLSLLALMGAMGGEQQAIQQPTQPALADVKSFEKLGYGDIFGPKLQFADGGSVGDLIAILRG